ncbi:MAG: hypothetical protein NT140_05260 [Deltaproteobacteria bacterium]|nr:hypothetical protein [Deltaproteobacteria bacterium]
MFCCARDEHGPSLEDKRKSVEEVKAKAVEVARKLETEKAAAIKTLAKVPVSEGNAVKFLSPNATKTRFPKNSREIFKYIPVFFGSFRVQLNESCSFRRVVFRMGGGEHIFLNSSIRRFFQALNI